MSTTLGVPDPAAGSTRRLRYEPALDGLRGVAVLAVIGYHGLVKPLRGGFIGVDIFFVLSGYLITALLLAEHAEAGRIDTRAFWARRARRLLPALLLLLVGVALYSEFVAFSGDRGRIRADALASLVYLQNWHLAWSGASYFAGFQAPSPLRHLWSLAIEEQFYLVWPPALIVLLRVAKGRRAVIVGTITVAMLASAALMAVKYHVGSDPSRVYYGTDTRAQELLVGALLAVLVARARPMGAAVARAVAGFGFAGAAVLAWVMTRAADSSTWLYRGGFLGIAVATAAVILAVTSLPTGWLRRALSVSPLRSIGRISYGLYLWHWPVMLWLDPDRTGWSGAPLLLLRVAVTFVIATLSFVFVEQPLRSGHRKRGDGRRHLGDGRRLAVIAAVTAVALLAAFSVPSLPATKFVDTTLPAGSATTAPRPGLTTPTSTPNLRAFFAGLLAKQHGWEPGDLKIEPDGRPLADGPLFVPSLDRGDGRPHILMVGDSVLLTLTRNFEPGPNSSADYYSYPEPGCGFLPGTPVGDGLGPILPVCSIIEQRWKLLVERRRPDVSFLLLGAWEVFDHEIDGHVYRVGTPAYAAKLRAALEHEVALFSSAGGLVALPTVPCFDPPDYGVAGAAGAGGGNDRRDPQRLAVVNSVIREVARAHPDVVRIVDLAGFLCPHGHARDEIGGVRMRVDGVHFTRGGAQIVDRWLAPRLEALVPPGPVLATRPTK